MKINKGSAYRKFKKEQENKQKEYERLGMSKHQIEQIAQFDKEVFLENLRYSKHRCLMPANNEFDDEEGYNPLLLKHLDSLSVGIENSISSRYWWIEELEDDRLICGIKNLSVLEIELITLIIIDGFTQCSVAKMMGVSNMSISKRMKRITSKLRASVSRNGGVENV